MQIRPLQSSDLPRLEALYYLFWQEHSDIQKMQAKFAALSQNDAYIFLGAIENQKLIGSVMGIVCEELYGDCAPFLVVEDMIVDAKYRKQGVGRALFAALEARAKAKGCQQIILVTETERTDACGFYESIGFAGGQNRGYKKEL